MEIERSKIWQGKWRVKNDKGVIVADNVSKAAARIISDIPRRVELLNKVRSGEITVQDVIDGTP